VTDDKNWRRCQRCGMERRATYPRGVVVPHNRWDAPRREMVPCEGSGKIGTPLSGERGGCYCPQCSQAIPAA
jgi:hypothetical protein